MAMTHARIPIWTAAAPAIGIAAYLLLGKASGALVGGAIAITLIAAVMAAVHHAEVVALRVGEPFGAVILALAVTVIEAGLIVSILLGDKPAPTMVRDTLHAVVVLVVHGLVGLCIVVGALRHGEQQFRTQGAQAFLIVLLPMAAITLVLPNYTVTVPGPFYSTFQLFFVAGACLALYIAFTFVQTVRHREFFTPNLPEAPGGTRPPGRLAAMALGLLLLSLGAVVLLAKAFSPFIQTGVQAVGAPAAIVGVIVAAIVLMPETAAALRAAAQNKLQTSINLALGSGVASIGLTMPLVAVVSWWMGLRLELGIGPGETMLLTLSFMMALITYGTGRVNLLSGIVHLILLCTWVFLIFLP